MTFDDIARFSEQLLSTASGLNGLADRAAPSVPRFSLPGPGLPAPASSAGVR